MVGIGSRGTRLAEVLADGEHVLHIDHSVAVSVAYPDTIVHAHRLAIAEGKDIHFDLDTFLVAAGLRAQARQAVRHFERVEPRTVGVGYVQQHVGPPYPGGVDQRIYCARQIEQVAQPGFLCDIELKPADGYIVAEHQWGVYQRTHAELGEQRLEVADHDAHGGLLGHALAIRGLAAVGELIHPYKPGGRFIRQQARGSIYRAQLTVHRLGIAHTPRIQSVQIIRQHVHFYLPARRYIAYIIAGKRIFHHIQYRDANGQRALPAQEQHLVRAYKTRRGRVQRNIALEVEGSVTRMVKEGIQAGHQYIYSCIAHREQVERIAPFALYTPYDHISHSLVTSAQGVANRIGNLREA